MKSLPLWKVSRELRRLRRQFADLPSDLNNYFFATGHYDRVLASQIRRFPGALPATARVAVFLMFPDEGLKASHLRTLAYFRDKGYATEVVSNLPLSESDRATVLKHCWRYLERPNFGYDFGGYRDAILDLAEDLPQLERLVLMNDSTWFPLPGSRDWLDDVETLGVDFAGAATAYATPRPEAEDFRSIRWNYRASHRNFNYCSFALCLSPPTMRNEGFLPFWRHLRLTDKKKGTVRRGEIGFTQWALKAGLSHGATLDTTALDHDLAKLDDGRLTEIARDLIVLESKALQAVKTKVVSDPGATRDELLALILTAASRQGASYALASYAIRERGFPFLKKSPIWLGRESSAITLALGGSLEGVDGREILNEALALRARRAPEFEDREDSEPT
jgi:hypothetical protein